MEKKEFACKVDNYFMFVVIAYNTMNEKRSPSSRSHAAK